MVYLKFLERPLFIQFAISIVALLVSLQPAYADNPVTTRAKIIDVISPKNTMFSHNEVVFGLSCVSGPVGEVPIASSARTSCNIFGPSTGGILISSKEIAGFNGPSASPVPNKNAQGLNTVICKEQGIADGFLLFSARLARS